jgi:DNA-binding NarL/FixJ family response regulator
MQQRTYSHLALPGVRALLTARQLEVARLLGDGYTNTRIARELGISLDGAKWHVGEVLGRLGFESRGDVMCWLRTAA